MVAYAEEVVGDIKHLRTVAVLSHELVPTN